MTDAYGNDAATSTGTIADTTNNAASGAPQRAESTERLARPLIKLAKACGLATSFIDQLGTYTEISDAALVAVLKALDVDASSDEAIVRSMTQLEVENSKRLLPSTIVATTGKPTGITLNCSSDADITASIELEDGTAFGHFALLPNLNSGKPDLTIAPDLPMGYHTLTVTVDVRAQVDALHDSVAARNDESTPMDINAAWEAKRPALRLIFEAGRNNKRELEFEHFKTTAGPDLDSFATWCLCFEVWGAPWGENRWFFEKTIDDPAVRQLVEEHHDLFEFNRWLQWIAAEQVNAAQQEALDHGMTLGLMQDMAVGVHGLGADAWANPERFASGGVTVGCPPDFYNQQGQDWGQPPFNPRYLEATGYQVYREMVHSMYEHAGAVRIDHVLGLFRLWWIPQGLGARNGAYVTYNHEAMLGVLAIEATRAGGMVVGEDLGTVPDYVRRILADHGVLGTDVEWFNRVDDSPNAGDPYRAPKDYRKQALASVTTHDLPPTAGYLNFAHVKLREELHLLSEPVEAFAASAMAERTAMMNRLVENGYISQTVADDVEGHVQEIVEAMHAMLTDTPSLLLQAALVDGVGECRSQNQPGTSREYSNWRVPLADGEGHVVHTDEVFDLPRVQSLAAVMRREKR